MVLCVLWCQVFRCYFNQFFLIFILFNYDGTTGPQYIFIDYTVIILIQWKTFTIANRDITHVCFCFLLKQTKPNNVWNLKWIKIIILLRQRYLKLLFSDTKWNFTIRWICLYRIFVEIFCYWWNIKSLLKILLFWQQNVIVLSNACCVEDPYWTRHEPITGL